MGYYINQLKNRQPLPALDKALFMVENIEGVKIIPKPTEFVENLVCVVENGPFDAAAYCYDENEFDVFALNDGRRKTWMIIPNAKEIAH